MDASQTMVEIRRLFPALAALPPALEERLLAECSVRRVAAGELLFDEQSPSRGFPLVLEGSVRVAKRGVNGREVRLYRVGPGECCVMSACCMLGHHDCAARAVAEDVSRLVLLSVELFDALVAGQAPFREFVFRLIGDRVAMLAQSIEAIAFRRLDQRLAALLADDGTELHISQQCIADQLGTVREVVGRALRDFEHKGWIELGREHIRVLDSSALARLADGEHRIEDQAGTGGDTYARARRPS